jgi:predicted aminopeptidase
MHQPDSEHQINATIDGEEVCGTVRYSGSTELYVQLDRPSIIWTESVHMPNFARAVHREGFLGEYGEERAMSLLIGMYKEQKKGDRRRRYAGIDYTEFGRLRYLREDPRFPKRGCVIREKAELNSVIHVQLEANGPYGLARFFDSTTNQPFLAEAAVYEETIRAYLYAVKSDVGFRLYVKAVRRRALPDMTRYAALRDTKSILTRLISSRISARPGEKAGLRLTGQISNT